MKMTEFNSIFNQRFATSQDGVKACQDLANASEFSVRIRTSKPNTVYLVCSCEGKPDYSEFKKQRSSERCQCSWRIVLQKNQVSLMENKWKFHAGRSMIHNHKTKPEHPSPSPSMEDDISCPYDSQLASIQSQFPSRDFDFSSDSNIHSSLLMPSTSLLNYASSDEISHFHSKPAPTTPFDYSSHDCPSDLPYEKKRKTSIGDLLN